MKRGEHPTVVTSYCRCGKIKRNNRRYCNRRCYWIFKVGTKQSKEHRKAISLSLKGKKKTPEHIKNAHEAWMKVSKNMSSGERHYAWKGDGALIGTIHDWVHRHFGAPKKCDHCGSKKAKTYHWANKSQEYKRIRSDWMRLCVPCHSKYDRGHPKSGYNLHGKLKK